MKPFKKVILILIIGIAYIVIVYFTFKAVAKVYRTNDPALAKKVVILTFFFDALVFGGSWYTIYKFRTSQPKK